VVASSQAEDAASEIAANNDQFTQWLQAMAETSDSDDEAPDSGSSDNNFSNLAASSGHARTDNKAHKRSKHSARSSSSHSSKGSKTKENYDSIGVLPPPTGKPVKITVSKHGKGDYKTINEALKSIKPNTKHRTIIKIKAGVYKYVMTSSQQA
jgi:pectin methylesterase-like acyl-CoA thioesterase